MMDIQGLLLDSWRAATRISALAQEEPTGPDLQAIAPDEPNEGEERA